jgi:uncharacterized membrane protein
MDEDYKRLYLNRELSNFKISRFIGWLMFVPFLISIINMIQFSSKDLDFLFFVSLFLVIYAPLFLAIYAPFKIIKSNKKIKELNKELGKER